MAEEEFDDILPPDFQQQDDDGLGQDDLNIPIGDGASTDEAIEGGVLPFLGMAYGLSKLIPLRKRFSNADEAFLKKYGGYKIGKMTVCREPIQNFLGVGLNLITLGKWKKAVAKYGYDKLFHLYLILDLIPPTYQGGKTITAIFEKNETPRITQMREPLSNSTECKPVAQEYLGTLNDFIRTTIAQMGDDFWRYNAFSNNCQTQILNALGANNLLSIPLQNFIKQDAQSIAQELPDYSKNIVQGITDTARRARTLVGKGLIEGRMKDKHTIGL